MNFISLACNIFLCFALDADPLLKSKLVNRTLALEFVSEYQEALIYLSLHQNVYFVPISYRSNYLLTGFFVVCRLPVIN